MKAGQGIPEIPPRRALPRLGQFLARRRARPPITPHEPRTIPLGTCQASCRTPRSEDRMASLATTIRAVRGPADGRRGARAKARRVGARRSALSRFMRFIRTPRPSGGKGSQGADTSVRTMAGVLLPTGRFGSTMATSAHQHCEVRLDHSDCGVAAGRSRCRSPVRTECGQRAAPPRTRRAPTQRGLGLWSVGCWERREALPLGWPLNWPVRRFDHGASRS